MSPKKLQGQRIKRQRKRIVAIQEAESRLEQGLRNTAAQKLNALTLRKSRSLFANRNIIITFASAIFLILNG